MDRKNDGDGRLSVIIPAYNCREYLERCIVSVISADPYEVIVIDDGSSDGTDQVCEMLSARYENLVMLGNHGNRGVAASRCAGVSRARGEYIAFVDADDWIEPEFLAQAVQILNFDDSVDIVVGRTLQDNGRGTMAYISLLKEKKTLECKEAVQGLFDWTLYRWELWGKVYRKKLFHGWMPDESVKICEDLDSNWELFRRAGQTVCLPIDYYHYFYNEKGASYNVNSIAGNSYKVFERIYRDGKGWLGKSQMTKVKEHYRSCLINLIRELLFQDGDAARIAEMQLRLSRLYNSMELERLTNIKRLCENAASAQGLMKEIEEKTVSLFYGTKQEKEQIYLYGTGIVADFVSRILLKNNCLDFEYMVSGGQMKKSSFHGRRVSFADHVKKDSVIWLSVNCSMQEQLYCELKDKGYQHVYKIDTQGVV